MDRIHFVKKVLIENFFWSVFSCIRTEYGNLLSKSSYSLRIQEKRDQKKLRIWTLWETFSCYGYGLISGKEIGYYALFFPIFEISLIFSFFQRPKVVSGSTTSEITLKVCYNRNQNSNKTLNCFIILFPPLSEKKILVCLVFSP